MRKLVISRNITDRKAESIERYLNDVVREKMINHEIEAELARKIRNGDKKAMEKLVKANLRFVVSVAKQYRNQGLGLSDLISEGNIGLIKAAYKFDETRGFKFISYAVWWIRRTIIEALMEHARLIRLPQNKVELYNKVSVMISKLEQTEGRIATTAELSEQLGIPEEKVYDILRTSMGKVSIDAPINDEEDQTMVDRLADISLEPVDHMLMTESVKKDMERVLCKLNERERKVITMYYGFSGTEYNLKEIAIQMGLSSERVRNIRDKAIIRLRNTYFNKLLIQHMAS